MPENRGGWPRGIKFGGGSNMNTAVTIAFYRYCRFYIIKGVPVPYSALNTSFKKPYRPTYLSPVNSII